MKGGQVSLTPFQFLEGVQGRFLPRISHECFRYKSQCIGEKHGSSLRLASLRIFDVPS